MGGYVWRDRRVMFEEKENFEKVVDFRVRVYFALIPCISFVVRVLNRFMHQSRETHWLDSMLQLGEC